MGEGQLERGGDRVTEREREGDRDRIERKNFKCRRHQVLRHYHYYFFILFVFLYFISSALMASFSCSTYPKKVVHNSEDILLFRNSSHIPRERERETGGGKTERSNAAPNAVACVFSINCDIRLINLFGSRITQLDRQTGGQRQP